MSGLAGASIGVLADAGGVVTDMAGTVVGHTTDTVAALWLSGSVDCLCSVNTCMNNNITGS